MIREEASKAPSSCRWPCTLSTRSRFTVDTNTVAHLGFPPLLAEGGGVIPRSGLPLATSTATRSITLEDQQHDTAHVS